MKKILYLSIFILYISCNSEKAGDCFQTAGDIVQQEVDVATFNKIVVHEQIELHITQGPTQKVIIESGENLLNDITAQVIDGELILKNYNSCNFVRKYDLTKVYVTSPDLNTIRNASELNVYSTGTLTYPSLYLRSSGEKSEFLSVGDWHLTIENNSVSVWSNGISNFYITGTTNSLNINFSDGDTRFEGQNFLAKSVNVSQVSSNDMLVHPLESLTGAIHSIGNVVSYNKPAVVTVDVQNRGKLLFK